MATETLPAPPPGCPNCGAAATGRYCAACGQETSTRPPRAREFLHEFVQHYFAAEGVLWRTLGALLFRPGRLTVEYFAGRRRRYVLPLRLYLSISIVFFVAVRLSAEARIEALATKGEDEAWGTIALLETPFTRAVRHPDGRVECTLPAPLCARIEPRLAGPPAEVRRSVLVELPSRVLQYLSTAMLVLLPLFAFWLKVAWPRRHYGEHLVTALHLHSFWFLLLLFGLLPLPGIGALVAAWLAVGSLLAVQRVYGGHWWATLLRGSGIAAVHVVVLLLATVALGIWAFVA